MTEPVLKILHYSCRNTGASWYRSPYYNKNLVIKSLDPFYKGVLDAQATLFVERFFITDLDKFYKNDTVLARAKDYDDESSYKATGYIVGEYYLDYIEKFDVYRFSYPVPVNTATTGLVKYLEELCNIKELNVNQFYDLLTTIQALNDFS